jgi:hypothetical protein
MIPFVFTQHEISAYLRVAPAAVSAWLRRGELRPVALTSTGNPLFDLRGVELIGRRLAAAENVRVLRPTLQGSIGPVPPTGARCR